MSNIKKLELLNIIFLSCIVIGFFKNGDEVVKYIGLFGSIIIYISRIILDISILNIYKRVITNNIILFISLVLFIFSIILSIYCAYGNALYSLIELKDEFLDVIIFSLIAISIKDKVLLTKLFLYAIILVFVFDILIYAIKYIKHNPHLNLSIRLERKMSDYAETLFPFVFASFFILHNNKIKYFLGILLLLGFVELFLTGARGAWISVISEIIIFFAVIMLFIYRDKFSEFIKISIGFILIVGISFYYLYQHSNLIQQKIHQGFNTSGRNIIVDTRLPIFLKYGNFICGIGGPGNYQYIKFLNDYKAPKIYGTQHKKFFYYWADEPYLLQIFYKEGLFGLFSFILLIVVFIKELFKTIKNTNNNLIKFYSLSIFSSIIGVYIIRGIVEGRDLGYLIFYITIFMILKEQINVKNS